MRVGIPLEYGLSGLLRGSLLLGAEPLGDVDAGREPPRELELAVRGGGRGGGGAGRGHAGLGGTGLD